MLIIIIVGTSNINIDIMHILPGCYYYHYILSLLLDIVSLAVFYM